MAELTGFGKAIKMKLIDLEMTQKDLQTAVTRRTGLYCDSSNLGKIMSGRLSSPRIVEAICEILNIEKD